MDAHRGLLLRASFEHQLVGLQCCLPATQRELRQHDARQQQRPIARLSMASKAFQRRIHVVAERPVERFGVGSGIELIQHELAVAGQQMAFERFDRVQRVSQQLLVDVDFEYGASARENGAQRKIVRRIGHRPAFARPVNQRLEALQCTVVIAACRRQLGNAQHHRRTGGRFRARNVAQHGGCLVAGGKLRPAAAESQPQTEFFVACPPVANCRRQSGKPRGSAAVPDVCVRQRGDQTTRLPEHAPAHARYPALERGDTQAMSGEGIQHRFGLGPRARLPPLEPFKRDNSSSRLA